MFLETVGRFTTKYPWVGIILISLLTISAVGGMVLKPMGESFDQEDFVPDLDVAKANTLYKDTFSSSYVYIILIRSPDGDVITKQGFLDMVELSDEIEADPTFQNYRESGRENARPMSPADSLYSMRKSVDGILDLKLTGEALGSYLEDIRTLNISVSDFHEMMEESGNLNDSSLDTAVENITSHLETFLENDTYPELRKRCYNDTRSYLVQTPNDEEMKSEIRNLFQFNLSDPGIGNASMKSAAFSTMSKDLVDRIEGSLESLDRVMNTTDASGQALRELETARGLLVRSMNRLNGLSAMGDSMGNPLVIGQYTRSFNLGRFVVLNFFSKGLDIHGDVKARGAMMLLNLDYSLYGMHDHNKEKLLEIEGNISRVVKDFDKRSDLSIHPMGTETISDRISKASTDSMKILLPIALVSVIIILFLIYRNLFDMILNITALSMAIVWMYGFGSLMGYSQNPMITAVPVLIVGLGIDYGIHLTMRYREEIRKGRTVKEALISMNTSVGVALFLATFTTILAFLSNIVSPVSLVTQFGMMAAFGIASSFIIMLIFLPSVKRLRDVRRAGKKKTLFQRFREGEQDHVDMEKKNKVVNRSIMGLTLRAERHPIIILVVVGLLTAGMLGAAVNNRVTFDVNDFLPKGLQESRDTSYLLNDFLLGGSGDFGIIIVEGNMTQPSVLRAMNSTMSEILRDHSELISIEGTGATARVKADFILYSLKDTASMLGLLDPFNPFIENYSRYFDFASGLPKRDTTPENVKLVFDMYYNMFPAQARKVIHRQGSDYTMSAIAITVFTKDDHEAWRLYDELRDRTGPIRELQGNGVERVTVTGTSIVMAVIITALQDSQLLSLMITMIVSLIVLTVVFFIKERSLVLGSVATLPVIFCVIWILGTMYLVGIPLNVMTITIGSLTIGLGITYGIHITHRFTEDVREEKDLLEASKKTILNTGFSLFGAAATTVTGFGLLSFATMPPLQQFGLVSALAILFSFLSSIIVLPVLLILWAKTRRKWRSMKDKRN